MRVQNFKICNYQISLKIKVQFIQIFILKKNVNKCNPKYTIEIAQYGINETNIFKY